MGVDVFVKEFLVCSTEVKNPHCVCKSYTLVFFMGVVELFYVRLLKLDSLDIVIATTTKKVCKSTLRGTVHSLDSWMGGVECAEQVLHVPFLLIELWPH